MPRFKILKHRLPIVPRFAHHVAGRKQFDTRYSPAIRAMWGIGDYGI
jgi:hypothetical protein